MRRRVRRDPESGEALPHLLFSHNTASVFMDTPNRWGWTGMSSCRTELRWTTWVGLRQPTTARAPAQSAEYTIYCIQGIRIHQINPWRTWCTAHTVLRPLLAMCRVPAWSDQQKAAQARVKGDRGLQSSAEAGGEEGKTGREDLTASPGR